MINFWQDFDENCKETWGMWFGSKSVDGHIVKLVGPYRNELDVYSVLGELA